MIGNSLSSVNFNKLNFSKTAVIGLDVEDWYHLDYLSEKEKNIDISMLDGFDTIMQILNQNNCKATLFVVGEIINLMKTKLLEATNNGYEIGCHGYTHKRPLLMTNSEFIDEITKTKKILENLINKKVEGFRAPCFSLDRDKLNLLFKNDYSYDSSKMDFKHHKLYGKLDLEGFIEYKKNIHVLKESNKIEFQLPTTKFLNQTIPFSGGGYIRLFPLYFLKKFIKEKEVNKEPIFMYLNPFEFSKKNINFSKLSKKNYFRMNIGRKSLPSKFNSLIKFMKERGWKFLTFKNIYEGIIK